MNMRSQPWTIFARTLIEILITWNSISEAAKIISLPGQPQVSFQQYSGYITVDESTKRSLFYYFVEAETDPASKPLVLWLNGGPGCSSVGAGAFCEHGPFKPSGNILLKNDYSWNKGANMLYLESPAGVGFSYSANQSFYTEVNDGKTAHDNLEFLRRWFLEFPEYKSRDFFITGESYAGHYVPQLAQLIVESKVNFSLKGIAIGNPLLEFNTDFNSRAEFFWSHGLISDSSYESATLVCNYSTYRRQIQIIGSVSPACYGVWRQAFKEVSKFVDLYDVTLDVCLSSVSTQSLMLNHLQETAKIDVCVEDQTTKYLNRKDVQKAFHAELHGVTEWTVCSNAFMESSAFPSFGSSNSQHGRSAIEDPMNPLFLHHSNSLELVLVLHQLTGDNYTSWSRAMMIALSVKNKLRFIDGSIMRPDGTDANLLNSWIRNNNIVISWILNSVSKEISASVLFSDSAFEIWIDLRDRFQQSNGPRIFQLRRELVNHVQN